MSYITFCSYPKGGNFTTKLDLKHLCSITYKSVFGKRKPAFWIAAVRQSFIFVGIHIHCYLVVPRCQIL
jgi:hypothetical protein